MDDLINVTKIIGSESSDNLTETDFALRDSFESAMTSSLEAIRCNSATNEGKKMKTKVVEVVEIYTQSQVGDDLPDDYAIPVTEDVSFTNEQDADIWRSQSNSKLVKK